MTDVGLIVVGVLSIVLQWGLYIPYSVYNLWKFRTHVSHRRARLLKRHPNITMVAVLIGIIWLAIYTMAVLYTTFFDSLQIIYIIYAIIGVIFNFSFSYTILCRVWLAYYQINYHFSSSQQEWQKYIHQKALEQDWYMQNLHTYGDVTYCIKRTIGAIVGTVIIFYLWYVCLFLFTRVHSI